MLDDKKLKGLIRLEIHEVLAGRKSCGRAVSNIFGLLRNADKSEALEWLMDENEKLRAELNELRSTTVSSNTLELESDNYE